MFVIKISFGIIRCWKKWYSFLVLVMKEAEKTYAEESLLRLNEIILMGK
jgi:hypothetical protein